MSTSDLALTAAELTAIRNDVGQLMPDTCTIQSVSTSSNIIGEAVRSYSNRGTAISCRLDPMTGAKEEYGLFGAVIESEGNWILTLPHNQTILTTDRVIKDSTTFEVIYVDPEKSWKASVRAVLKEIGT
jgi:hypothetical protein